MANIKKGNAHLIKQKRVVPVLCDGRKGLPEYGPYQVIHLGGAVPEVTSTLLDQLAPGGILWAPVGPRESQNITLFVKA